LMLALLFIFGILEGNEKGFYLGGRIRIEKIVP